MKRRPKEKGNRIFPFILSCTKEKKQVNLNRIPNILSNKWPQCALFGGRRILSEECQSNE